MLDDYEFWFDWNLFRTDRYLPVGFDVAQAQILDAVLVFMEEGASWERRKAAQLLLHLWLTPAFYNHVIKQLLTLHETITDRNDPRVWEWRKAVLSRGKCEKCGSTENLQAHHIEHWALCPEKRADVANSACLCVECHAKEHDGERCFNLILSKKVDDEAHNQAAEIRRFLS